MTQLNASLHHHLLDFRNRLGDATLGIIVAYIVMAGPFPAIHDFLFAHAAITVMDDRHKGGHDG